MGLTSHGRFSPEANVRLGEKLVSTVSILRDVSLDQIAAKAEAETRAMVTEKFASRVRNGRNNQGGRRMPDR